jgi:hypothetical protein
MKPGGTSTAGGVEPTTVTAGTLTSMPMTAQSSLAPMVQVAVTDPPAATSFCAPAPAPLFAEALLIHRLVPAELLTALLPDDMPNVTMFPEVEPVKVSVAVLVR